MHWEKKHDRLIVLDFDHTTFNTTAFFELLKERFAQQFNISPEKFDAIRKQNMGRSDKLIAGLAPENQTALNEAGLAVAQEKGKEVVYEDTKDFIDRHKEFDILLLSAGRKEWQEAKIIGSGLAYLPYTVPSGSKASEFASFVNEYQKIYFIDDKADQIDEVKDAYPQVTTYLMRRRGDNPYSNEAKEYRSADKVVKNLDFTIPVEQ